MAKYKDSLYPDKINDFIDNDGNISELGRSKIFGYTEVTYDQLKELRDNKKLIPGATYRLTDYCGMEPSSELQLSNSGHQFDLLLIALTEDTLSEDAKACAHHFDNPESPEALYFLETNFGAWKIKYCLDPDAKRFNWLAEKSLFTPAINLNFYYMGFNSRFNAHEWSPGRGWVSMFTQYGEPQGIKPDGSLDFGQVQGSFSQYPITRYNAGTTGGVIYELVDEFNNTAPYDFKNILYKGQYLFNLFKSDYSGHHNVDASMNANYHVINNIVKAQYAVSSNDRQMKFPYHVLFSGENIYNIVFDNKYPLDSPYKRSYTSRDNRSVFNNIFRDTGKPDQSLNDIKLESPYDDIFNSTLAPRKYLYMGQDSRKNMWCQFELEWDAIKELSLDTYVRVFSNPYTSALQLAEDIKEAIENPDYLSTKFRIIKGLIYDDLGNKYPIYTKNRPNLVMIDGVMYKEYWSANVYSSSSTVEFRYIRENMTDQTHNVILNPYFFFNPPKLIVPPQGR